MILICGMPGAGETTVSNMLRKKGYEVINMADIVAKRMNEKGT